jgi:acetyltransferase-like isoleucine patch superfamily enzyme
MNNVRRLIDKKSQSHPRLLDKIRSFVYRKFFKLNCGQSTIFKKNILISVSDNGILKIGDNCLFHEGVNILLTLPNPKLLIGHWVFIGKDTIIASKNNIEIGDYTIFAPRCYIIDHEHGFDLADIILNQNSNLKQVIIGKDCYFGTGCVITAGVKIGDGAIIGANSVVVTDIPDNQIWGGAPARYIRDR